MRIITRGDMDGLASCVFLTIAEDVKEIRFVHPKDVQDGAIQVDAQDILVNLPYVKGCGMWFDHHVSEQEKAKKVGKFKGAYGMAPSAARLVHDFYKDARFEPLQEMLEAIDRFDSGNLTEDDVNDPKGWILLSYTIDPRTGLGPEFQKYFRWLAEYIKEVPIAKILQHPEVKKRVKRVQAEQIEFKKLLGKHSRLDGNVVITDLREFSPSPAGNRFLVFTMFPKANVEVRVFWGKGKERVIVACGHSIFNRTAATRVPGRASFRWKRPRHR
jgi:hypothetical protein